MRPIPHVVGLYLAVLQLVFALGWTVYAIYLPRLAASVGISGGAVVFILMLDQVIFTITDFAMGVAADRMSHIVGRLGRTVAVITLLSCLAFVGIPLVAEAHVSPTVFLLVTALWSATSSALRAPPLMLLGKYAARPAIPYLASLAMVGLGAASAVSPYLAMVLTKQDPRLPFAIASVTLLLTTFALAKVERILAKQAPAIQAPPPPTVDRAVPAAVFVFALASLVLAVGFQIHSSFNTPPLLKRFTPDISELLPVFWVGFCVGMFPASRITKRYGGLPVMGIAGLIGAAAIVVMERADTLELVVAAQVIAGAAWGCILMSALSAAATLGYTGAEGTTTGLLFSTLALATFARLAASAAGVLSDAALAPLLHWAPIICWGAAGVALVVLSIGHRPLTNRSQALRN